MEHCRWPKSRKILRNYSIAGLKGIFEFDGNLPSKLYVRLIGIDKMQSNSSVINGNSFKINTIQGTQVKVIVFSDDAFLGQSNVINVWNKKDNKNYEENENNEFQNIGTIKIQKIPLKVENKEQIMKVLGLPERAYQVNYSKNTSPDGIATEAEAATSLKWFDNGEI